MSLSPAWLVVADDLTGACDTGAAFALRGWRTRVSFTPGADLSAGQVWVISTESRALAEELAILSVEQAVRAFDLSPIMPVYKKIDSTLRGHPGEELGALMRLLGADRALIAPAFPEQGRVTCQGQVWVYGQPLAQTVFAGEVRQPDLPRAFGSSQPARLLGLEQVRGDLHRLVTELARPGITIADAETVEDLLSLARAGQAAGLRVWCGSAGLARALIALQAPPERPIVAPAAARVTNVFAVVGSRSPAAMIQVEAARQAGVLVFSPGPDDIRIDTRKGEFARQVAAGLRASGAALVSVAALPEWQGGAQALSGWLGNLTAAVEEAVPGAGLVLTGGDTAAAACRALGCGVLNLSGEIEPGVVWGHLAEGKSSGLPVVTKAGGFGGPETLLHALRFLTGRPL